MIEKLHIRNISTYNETRARDLLSNVNEKQGCMLIYYAWLQDNNKIFAKNKDASHIIS